MPFCTFILLRSNFNKRYFVMQKPKSLFQSCKMFVYAVGTISSRGYYPFSNQRFGR